MKRNTMIRTLLLTVCFSLAGAASAMASTKITDVSLNVDSQIEAGDSECSVDVSANSHEYYVDDVEVTNEPKDEWEDNDKPKLKVTVRAESGYTFDSGLGKSDVDLDGSDGKVTSVSRSSSRLYVYITLDAIDDDRDYDLYVDNLEWDGSGGVGYWDGCDDADHYELRLYRGSNSVKSSLTTDNTSYDFSSYITESGTYTFRVRAVRNSSNRGSWEESDEWYVSSSDVPNINSNPVSLSSSGAWLLDSVGWWYCNADRSYTVNNWQYINDRWYYFNGNGYMQTGWIAWNSKWYYCGSDGAMWYSATTPDGYYVGSDGAWVQ